jgi:two-component system chemotaxis response regulator CheB
MTTPTRIVMIGASSGGVAALTELTAALPKDFPVAVLIVLHIGAHRSSLPELLALRCPLDVAPGRHGELPVPGTVRVAPPDEHMVIVGGRIELTRSAKENHTRPALDPLFRSGALEFGPAAIGVVLTGSLDDGTAGLQAIKAMGGIAVVQDPADAAEPSMPASALRYVRVDHCVPLRAMPALLASLARQPIEAAVPSNGNGMTQEYATMSPTQQRLVHEQALMLGHGNFIDHLQAIGQPSMFTCPECHGALWELRDVTPRRLRCHTGHAFTERSLQQAQTEGADEALWAALRALQEKERLLARQSTEQRDADPAASARLAHAAHSTARQAATLRKLLRQPTLPAE